MIKKQFLSRLTNFRLSILPLPPTSNNSPPLQRRRTTVKNENRLGPKKQKLTNTTEESKQMSVTNHFTFLITHRFDKLYHPYTRVWKKEKRKTIERGLRGIKGIKVLRDLPTASVFPARVSTETRRPTGESSSQRPWTPIFRLKTICCWCQHRQGN